MIAPPVVGGEDLVGVANLNAGSMAVGMSASGTKPENMCSIRGYRS
jgi:hypothetical protein